MGFKVIQPPKDEAKLAEVIRPVIEAAHANGLALEPEPFIYSWLNGTRLLVEEQDGVIVGVALMAVGIQWINNDFTATLLANAGKNKASMLEFAKTISAALGAAVLTAEDETLKKKVSATETHRVLVEYALKEG